MPEPATGPAALLWDMDGTLVDTEPIWWRIETATIAEFGGVWTDADCHALVGASMPIAVAAWLKKIPAGRVGPDEIAALVFERVAAALRDEVSFQPGALELLRQANQAQIPNALVTASFRLIADAVLDSCPVRFDASVAGDEVTRSKPDPEPYRRAASLLGVDAADCVALEDSPGGTASASASGAYTLAVPMAGIEIPPRPRQWIRPEGLAGLDLAGLSQAYAGNRNG